MCLLIVGKSNVVRSQLLHTAGLIEDIFQSNADGLGVMYAKAGGACKIVKRLPASAAHARRVVEALPNDDRMVAMHWRMRTHGDIDLANCHPYQINEASWLMHNGVLRTGNAADTTKSDTWHFAKDYLADAPPDVLHNPNVADMIADYIGNNRFAILSADGRMSVVNRDQGIEHDDVWYSNTYAWSPELLIPTYEHTHEYTFGGLSRFHTRSTYSGMDGLSEWWDEDAAPTKPSLAGPELDSSYMAWIEDVALEAMEELSAATLTTLLEDVYTVEYAVDFILDTFDITAHKASESYDNLGPTARADRDNWITGARTLLRARAKAHPGSVAEALLYYCDWTPKIDAQVTATAPAAVRLPAVA